jgi:hypothetical protein
MHRWEDNIETGLQEMGWEAPHPSIHPLGATAVGVPWPPQQPVSTALCLSPSPPTALSSLLSSLLRHHINIVLTFQVAIIKSDFQTSFVNVCFSSFRGSLLGFGTNFFYCVGLSAPRQTPKLEDQGIPFHLSHHPGPVWHGRPYQ